VEIWRPTGHGLEGVKTGWGIYRGLEMKFGTFCNFFRIFWCSNGQITASSTDSPRGPIKTRHVISSRPRTPTPAHRLATARLRPPRACQRGRDCSCLLSPSRPPLASLLPKPGRQGGGTAPIGTSLSNGP
jgi:hypothetical protein